jgi:hypothetical protein
MHGGGLWGGSLWFRKHYLSCERKVLRQEGGLELATRSPRKRERCGQVEAEKKGKKIQ